MQNKRILVLEDEPILQELYKKILGGLKNRYPGIVQDNFYYN